MRNYERLEKEELFKIILELEDIISKLTKENNSLLEKILGGRK